MHRRALVGLNKGEAHLARKRAINFPTTAVNCGAEPGRSSTTGSPGLNLLAATIIHWDTLKLGVAVFCEGTGRALDRRVSPWR